MESKKKHSRLTQADALRLIHELEVHQIELELQSQELIREKEKAVAIASQKYEELFDYAPSGYFTFNRNGEIVKVNLSGAKLLGKVRLHLVNSSFGFFLAADSRIVFSDFIDAIFAGNGKLDCELSLSADFIDPVFIQLTGILSEDPDLCRVIVSDVTTQKQLEQNLSEANTELVFQNEEKEKRSAELVIANEELVFQNKEKANRSAELVIANKELVFQNAEKANRAAELTVANNDLIFQNEKELKLVAELATLNAEKDKFFSVIAHDLRGPLSSFLGLTSLLNEKLTGMTLDEIQVMAILMKKSATNLNNLLGNLLEWSRMQRGLATFNPVSFILRQPVSEIIETIQEAANKKNISISTDIPAGLKIFADVNMLMSIMRNLCSNAVKFTYKGGSVLVSAKPVSGNWIEISVKDTGIGMNETLLQDLFRIDGNSSRKGTDDEPSTGLGLIICKDFIEKHAGILSVESQEGQGSIFRFTLPAMDEMNEATLNPVENFRKQNRKLKILITEDDEISEMLMSIALKSYSREILKANNGTDAVEICRNNPDIDLVLMDIKMPGLNGYEATREIRRFNADVVIIGQSAYGDIVDQEAAMELGWNDYIPKPFDPVLLRTMVQKYF